MAYVFRGTNRTDPAYMSEPLPTPTKCGTRAGYRWHQNHDVPACADCLAANREYMRAHPRKKAA